MDDVKTFVVGKKLYHDSSSKQVTGEAVYVDDISTPDGTLHAALITSPSI
jgi:xanthine dehydrogenase molybdopterin-binding subunit B